MLCVSYERTEVLWMVQIFLMNRVFECHPITDSQHIYGLVNVSLWVWSVCFSSKYTAHIHAFGRMHTIWLWCLCLCESVPWSHSPQTLNMAFVFSISFFLWHEISTLFSFISFRFTVSPRFDFAVFNPRHRNVSLFFFHVSKHQSLLFSHWTIF